MKNKCKCLICFLCNVKRQWEDEHELETKTMKTIYKPTDKGWEKVRKCQSFQHACKIALELEAKSGIKHCVNK